MNINKLAECVPVYTCEMVDGKATGYMLDGCGNRTSNEAECPPGSTCIPHPYCELDSEGNRTGYEFDGCGNKNINEAECGPVQVQDNTRILYLGAAFMAGVLATAMFKKV